MCQALFEAQGNSNEPDLQSSALKEHILMRRLALQQPSCSSGDKSQHAEDDRASKGKKPV